MSVVFVLSCFGSMAVGAVLGLCLEALWQMASTVYRASQDDDENL